MRRVVRGAGSLLYGVLLLGVCIYDMSRISCCAAVVVVAGCSVLLCCLVLVRIVALLSDVFCAVVRLWLRLLCAWLSRAACCCATLCCVVCLLPLRCDAFVCVCGRSVMLPCCYGFCVLMLRHVALCSGCVEVVTVVVCLVVAFLCVLR